MPKVKVSSKGWIVIPADIRRRYGIEPGDEVHIVDYGGSLGIVPKLADQRRRELEREEARIAGRSDKDGR